MDYIHKIQYYETDRMQIVHHSNYVRWMEEARVDFLDRIGASFMSLEEMGIVSPVTEVSCRYVGMTRFGDTVRITICLEEFDGVRMRVRYLMRSESSGGICCIAQSSHCFMENGRVINMKKRHPDIYERFLPEVGRDSEKVTVKK